MERILGEVECKLAASALERQDALIQLGKEKARGGVTKKEAEILKE